MPKILESLHTESNLVELPKELWKQISINNPTTYYKLLQVSKVFKLDTDMMKAKFIRKTESDGDIHYKLPNGWLHSCDDYCSGATKPAVIRADGGRLWYADGKIHRDGDQPAVVLLDGSLLWYINGEIHRDNGQPAEIWADGSQFWWEDGNPVASWYAVDNNAGEYYKCGRPVEGLSKK